MKLTETLQKLGCDTHTTRLTPKTTHVIISGEYEADDKSQAWIASIEEKAPNAEILREKDLKGIF